VSCSTAEHAGWKQQQSTEQFKRGFRNEANSSEWQRNKPHDGKKHDGRDRNEGEKNQNDKPHDQAQEKSHDSFASALTSHFNDCQYTAPRMKKQTATLPRPFPAPVLPPRPTP
jgi:hypothetical protein